ncbi:MAG: hypothetical protein ABIR47_03985 [Candidatus Kapaibacterium sp.]
MRLKIAAGQTSTGEKEFQCVEQPMDVDYIDVFLSDNNGPIQRSEVARDQWLLTITYQGHAFQSEAYDVFALGDYSKSHGFKGFRLPGDNIKLKFVLSYNDQINGGTPLNAAPITCHVLFFGQRVYGNSQ